MGKVAKKSQDLTVTQNDANRTRGAGTESRTDSRGVVSEADGLDVVKGWRDKGLVFNPIVTPNERVTVGTRYDWNYYNFTLDILYETGWIQGVTPVLPRDVQDYVVYCWIVEGFNYYEGAVHGEYFGEPRLGEWDSIYLIDLHSKKELDTFEYQTVMYNYISRLRDYLWGRLPDEYRDYIRSESNIKMNYRYQWGMKYDDATYTNWYDPDSETNGPGSGSVPRPPEALKCKLDTVA